MLILALADIDGSGVAAAADTPGEYSVVGEQQVNSMRAAKVYYQYDDSSCNASKAFGASGKVTVTSADPGSGGLTGTFDVTLNTGDHLSGQFNSAGCAATAAYLNYTGPCQN